jgi:hypothetical protein
MIDGLLGDSGTDVLYTNGCSWTFGSELEQDVSFVKYLAKLGWKLQDPTDTENWNVIDKKKNIVSRLDFHYDNFNWSGHLKELLNIPTLINQSFGGGSNHRILRTTLEYIMSLTPTQQKKTLVVIGWTASERNEIYINKTWQRWNTAQKFSETVDINQVTDTELITRVDKLQEDYLSNVFDDYPNILDYFSSVYLLSNTLTNLGVKHLFFNALPPWWEAGHLKTDCDPFVEMPEMLAWHEASRNLLSFRDSMMGFVHRGKFKVGKHLHPLRAGHVAWAEHLYSKLKENIIL